MGGSIPTNQLKEKDWNDKMSEFEQSMDLPTLHWEPGDKESMTTSAVSQMLFLLTTWYMTSVSNGTEFTDEDISALLDNVDYNWKRNAEAIRLHVMGIDYERED